jgi:hypothetical protein
MLRFIPALPLGVRIAKTIKGATGVDVYLLQLLLLAQPAEGWRMRNPSIYNTTLFTK